MIMRKIIAIIMMACILMTGGSSAPATEATQAPATEAAQAPATEATQAPVTEAEQAPATEATQSPATEAAQEPATEATQEATTAEQATMQTTTETSTEASTETSEATTAAEQTATVSYSDGTVVKISWKTDMITYQFSDGMEYSEDEESWYDGALEILNDPLTPKKTSLEVFYGEQFVYSYDGKNYNSDELPDSTRFWIDVSVGDWKHIHEVETGQI